MRRNSPTGMVNITGRLLLAAASCAVVIVGCPTRAAFAAGGDEYPTRPIRIVVPFVAGTQLDLAARLVGSHLADAMGQAVVVDNRPGASGNIGSEVVAKSAPDGYTLLMTGSLITLLPSTAPAGAVDPVAAFAPVTKLGRLPLLIVVNPSLGVRTLPELIALARSRPGAIAYATQGVGSTAHLSATMLSRQAGIELLHVPYPIATKALQDVLSGEVPVYFTYLGSVESLLRGGQLRVLAVASAKRISTWPDVPTLADLGYQSAVVDPWNGLLAPADTPPEILDRLHREISRIVQRSDVRENLLIMGMEPMTTPPAEFATEIKMLTARWPAIVKDAGIRRE